MRRFRGVLEEILGAPGGPGGIWGGSGRDLRGQFWGVWGCSQVIFGGSLGGSLGVPEGVLGVLRGIWGGFGGVQGDVGGIPVGGGC